ncbi:MAG: chromosomal replication initiator DnaA [Proteobacteria bacterium]|nr:chromosomal replication initiator DnaA [Pseudomonadota bacterium]
MKQALREHLLQTCSDTELASWFDPLELSISEESGSLFVCFPHAYFGSWFETNMQPRFEAKLGQFLGEGLVVTYRIGGNGSTSLTTPTAKPVTAKIDFPFDSQFIFETFLINKKNYFPLASAREVTKQSGSLFNPFIICGRHGSGKTHLLRSIANEISKKADRSTILFLNMDELHNLYRLTFASDKFKARDYICSHQHLFIDDFQQIQKYDNLQQEIIIIFNHFYENKKQMGFACLDKISSYDFLDPTLLSRLEWGLIVNLKQPDLEIRIEYIQDRARVKKLPLTKEQVLTLAQRFKDFRYLQGILIKLTAFRELVRKDLSKKDFDHIINNTEEKTTETLSPEHVIATVGEHFNMTVKEIKSSKRHAKIAQARQISMWLCKKLLPISYPALGRAFGGKDHSTVLYSVKKIDQLQEDDENLKRVLRELKKKCVLYGRG